MNMGERLKELRLQKNATQEDVGKIINVSKATIMKYEKGLVENLKRSSIEKLAKYFNVAPSYLMCLDEENSLDNNQIAKKDKNYFEFVSEDDSMYPLLDIGDIALVYKQDTIDETNLSSNNAGTYLIKINEQHTIRIFFESQDKKYYTLEGMNVACKPIKVQKADLSNTIIILGKVVEIKNKSAFK